MGRIVLLSGQMKKIEEEQVKQVEQNKQVETSKTSKGYFYSKKF